MVTVRNLKIFLKSLKSISIQNNLTISLGIHKLFHCAPNVPHYAKNKAVGVMKPGNAFTIEPMISEGVWTDQTWPDNWTAVTTDGKLSAQVSANETCFF